MKGIEMRRSTICINVTVLALATVLAQPLFGGDPVPDIKTISRPAAGFSEIIFHGGTGPFQIQTRSSLDPSSPWLDMPDALVTQLEPGVFLGQFPNGKDELGFYRCGRQSDGIAELRV